MTAPLRLAVLSDLHVHRKRAPDSWTTLEEALEAVARARIDHVVLAGDTFDCADAFEQDADAVREALDDAGWWTPEKLTVVVGNHDIFQTPHHGGRFWQAATLAQAMLMDAGNAYDAFCEWAGDLVEEEDRLDDTDLFPFAKQVGHLVLFANDTTGPNTAHSVNGYWDEEDDDNLRRVEANGLRTVLAIHHPPEQSPKRNLLEQGTEGVSFGFPKQQFHRLEAFLDDLEIEAVVCGHVHDNGGDPFTWSVGNGTRAFMMGRTGGLDEADRCFGVLEVPARGPLRWKVRKF